MRDEILVKSIKKLHSAFDAELPDSKLSSWLDSIPWNWDEGRFDEACQSALARDKRCPTFARIKEIYESKHTQQRLTYKACERCDGFGRVFVIKDKYGAVCRCDLCSNGQACFSKSEGVRTWSISLEDDGYSIRYQRSVA